MAADPDPDPDCELCEAARYTHWYSEDATCWVADCEICSTPMVVWATHGIEPTKVEVEHMMKMLANAGSARFGEGNYQVDTVMRQIPGHFHAHARDDGWHARRWIEPMSRYTGVGTERTTH